MESVSRNLRQIISKWKDAIIHSIFGLMLIIYYQKWINIFLNHTKNHIKNVKAEWDLSNYVTKSRLKEVTCVDTLAFAKKLDKLKIDDLKTVPPNLNN